MFIWDLTTPTNPGDMGDAATQVRAKTLSLYGQGRALIVLEYGNSNENGVFIKAHEPPPSKPPQVTWNEAEWEEFYTANTAVVDAFLSAVAAKLAVDADIDPGEVAS